MSNTEPQAPRIHLNGTSGEHLESYLRQAAEAVRAAVEAVQQTHPNARDYYPIGDGAFNRAASEHRSRMERLRAVAEELAEIHRNVGDQQTARRTAR